MNGLTSDQLYGLLILLLNKTGPILLTKDDLNASSNLVLSVEKENGFDNEILLSVTEYNDEVVVEENV